MSAVRILSKIISWNMSAAYCLQDRVKCDKMSGQVIELDLNCSLLVGTIDSSSTLFQPPHLERLNIFWNNYSNSDTTFNVYQQIELVKEYVIQPVVRFIYGLLLYQSKRCPQSFPATKFVLCNLSTKLFLKIFCQKVFQNLVVQNQTKLKSKCHRLAVTFLLLLYNPKLNFNNHVDLLQDNN